MLYNWFRHIEFANNWVLPFLLMLPVMAWKGLGAPGAPSNLAASLDQDNAVRQAWAAPPDGADEFEKTRRTYLALKHQRPDAGPVPAN